MNKSIILKMRDIHQSLRVRIEGGCDLPLRQIVVGKSQYSGKSNFVANELLRPYDDTDEDGKIFFRGKFDQIYIVCPSFDIDSKWHDIQKGLDIPDNNIYRQYDETELTDLYKRLEDQYHEYTNEGKTPPQCLIILDDCSYSGDLKNKVAGILAKIASNGRHILLSMIVTAQKYSSISTTIRENCTSAIFFECTKKQQELIYEDFGVTSKKEFERIMREATKERHGFLHINFSNPIEDRFCNASYKPIPYDISR